MNAMPEPLKNLYNHALIAALCAELASVYKPFDTESFSRYVFDETWQSKELKARMGHIAEALRVFLPQDYGEAVSILKAVAPKFTGFEYMFFPWFVERYGIDEFEISIEALEHFTVYSSSEFAVRPFIRKYGARMMEQMRLWARSDNFHHRRLASEGCRPRLPWAMALPEFKKEPAAVLEILEMLKNDESEYVRRSVANNLNDISKDNPHLIIAVAKTWLGKRTHTDRMLKHACRSLLKQGEPEIMALFGFSAPEQMDVHDFSLQDVVVMGDALNFSFVVSTAGERLGKLRLEYAIDFKKSNGTLSRKVFKLSESFNKERRKAVAKSHVFKKISTRRYYAGVHALAVIVNGHELASGNFRLDDTYEER